MPYSTNLPIEEVIPEVRRALEKGRSAVLEAPPGAGKTTVVPLALTDEPWLGRRRIVMLEPRRLAARAAAGRMSSLLSEGVGQTVGYRTRLDSKVGPGTRIEVVTEGILTRFLQNDPSLEGIGILIFDEFHERSIYADLGLALALDTRDALREDLRVLVMSATLDGEEVSRILGGAPIIKSPGRAFQVDVRYQPGPPGPARAFTMTGPAFIQHMAETILRALREERGSVLVFLPGSSEIKRAEAALRERGVPTGVDVVPLYGDLPREMQDLAIMPSPPGRRKVVLATSIAETSLTIEGVRVVIDCGLMRVPRFSPSSGMGSLETIRVTKASAEQRRGRAGRVEPGVCIRLWTRDEDKYLREKNTPEILEADLTPLALELAVWGVRDPGELRWLDPPPIGAMSHAKEVLTRLGAIDAEGKATRYGREMARLPLHPRLGHMVLKGKELGLGTLACTLSALLTERDVLRGPSGRDPDIRHRLDVLLGETRYAESAGIDRSGFERIKAISRQMSKALAIRDSSVDVEKAGLLLAFAYPDRIARRREGAPGRYLLASGRGAYFPGPEPLASEEYLVITDLDGAERESLIFLAAPVKEAELEEHFSGEMEAVEAVTWDQAEMGVSAKRTLRLGSIVLRSAPLKDPGKERVLDAMISGIRENGLGALPWDRDAVNLRARINLLHRVAGKTGVDFPDLSDEWLLANLKEWLGPWLEGMTRLEHLKKLDLEAAILGTLTREKRKALERLAPTHITVPSGSRIAIDYSGHRPVLAVRLQEMFGLERTPAIADGAVTLLLHLLSPAGRPVQVTEDLAGFWASAYPAVRKELKGRYPKHHWPEDPMKAQAQRGAKKRVR